MHPIRNLWGHLDLQIRKRPITLKTELKNVLQEEWDKIGEDYLKKNNI